jgi:hypothetical protein
MNTKMKSVFEPAAFAELNRRIQLLQPTDYALWGKMHVAQMLAHLCMPLEGQLGKVVYKERGNFFLRLFKPLLYNDRDWGKNVATAKSFVVSDARDFSREQARLIQNIEEAHLRGLQGTWSNHPIFGKFTAEQHGKMVYKHVDHHFRQFGV